MKQLFTLEKELLINTGCDNDENLQFLYYVFIKHLLSYFVRNRSKSASLAKKEQKRLIALALDDSLVKEIISKYTPKGLAMKLITKALKKQKITLCYLIAYFIDTLKN